MANQEPKQGDDGEQEPLAVEMDDQGPTYGTSFSETEPGQITANRRNALQGDREGDSLGIDEAAGD